MRIALICTPLCRYRSCLILLFFVCTSVFAENDKAFFWQVKSSEKNAESTTLYLMGSIHFADESFYPLRGDIERAFERSDYLVVELDTAKVDPVVYNSLLTESGVFTDGGTIKDIIAEETWLQLRQRLRQLNISYDAVKKFKPGVLVLTLSAFQVMSLGFDPQLGIDIHFLNQARKPLEISNVNAGNKLAKNGRVKTIIELETLEQQINLFLDMPDGELLLKESLYSFDESETLMADMVRYWKAGDEKQINKLLFEDALTEYPAFTAIYDSLFYRRNKQMTIKIENMLKREGIYFVVVGSGHLIGEKGIVNLLKEKGYVVTRH